MKIVYQWRELSAYGLLRMPAGCGPNAETPNGYAGNFPTTRDATISLSLHIKKWGYNGETYSLVELFVPA